MRRETAIAVGFVGALGCSSSALDPRTSDVRSFCTAYIDAAADHAYACEGGSREAYDALLQALDFCNVSAAAIGASHVYFDSVAAAACVAEIPGLACWQNSASSPNCAKIFTGTVSEGGSCYRSMPMGAQECVPGTYCNSDGPSCTGTCVRYAQVGDACDIGSRQCEPPLYCLSNSTGTTCVDPMISPVSIGKACDTAGDCIGDEGTLTCVGPNGAIIAGAAGTCQVPADSGPCMTDLECRSHLCAGATGTTPGTCQPAKHVGDACTPGAGECGSGVYCGPASTCIILPSVGQSCAGYAGEGRECVDGVCDPSGICLRFGKQGDACDSVSSANACGIGKLSCDAATLTCAPACWPGNGCGARGQICCADQRCNAGATCHAGRCG